MQAELRTWLQHYVCCTKPYKSNLKWSNSNRKNSKTNRREGSRVTFSKKVNKVEPLYIDNNGVIKQRSYISLLSSASEDSDGEELRLFVEKYVNQTVHDAAAKYFRELERELRIKNRAESKYNDIRKFSIIREETETSVTNGSESESRLSMPHLRYDSNGDTDQFYGVMYDELDESFNKEDTLSKSNLLENSDEDNMKIPSVSESESDSEYSKFNYNSDSSRESEYIDREKDKVKQVSNSTNKSKVVKKTKKIKTKSVRKENSATLVNEKNKKRNKVEPYKPKTVSCEKNSDLQKVKKKRNPAKKPTKLVIKSKK